MVRWVSSRPISFTREPPPKGFLRQRPDFHRAFGCSRASRSPFEGSVNGREFQDDKPCQLLLRIGIRSVLYAALSIPEAHCCSCLGHFKRIGPDVHSGIDERPVVSPPSAEMRIAIVVLAHVKLFGCMVDHQSKLHQFSPMAQFSLALR